MREVVFRILAERTGQLEAQAESLPIRITAPTLEELQTERPNRHLAPGASASDCNNNSSG